VSPLRLYQSKAPETRFPLTAALFGILLALEVFDLAPLGFDFALLLLNLALRLIVLDLLILHMVADRIAANRADTATNSRARPRMPDRCTYDGSGTRANQGPAARAHLSIGERLPVTSTKEKRDRNCHSGSRNHTFTHLSYLLLPRLYP
jgi:hypothetical protein